MFGFKRRRRQRIVAQPFPEPLDGYLGDNVRYWALLNEPERAKLRDDLRIFTSERRWTGCGGLQITDEITVTIAAQACLLVLAFPRAEAHGHFRRVREVLVYPAAYLIPSRPAPEPGIRRIGVTASGTAHFRGPVALSWADALAGGRNAADGRNVVLHEFAHKLDMVDDLVDGTPPLRKTADYRRWREVMTTEYLRLRSDADHGRATLLNTYGAQSPPEFFAVCTECFFERPRAMREKHPELYAVLQEYFRQDTADRKDRK